MWSFLKQNYDTLALLIGGAGGVYTFFSEKINAFFRRKTVNKMEDIEVKDKEIDLLKKMEDFFIQKFTENETKIEGLREKVEALEEEVSILKRTNRELQEEKDRLEKELNRLKNA